MTGTSRAANARLRRGSAASQTHCNRERSEQLCLVKIFGPEARGSVGATTTSRNTFSLYTRARNGRGGVGDSTVTTAVAGWQALTSAQQRAWNDWAAGLPEPNSLGVHRPLTGVAAYVRQSILLQFHGTPLTAPAGYTIPQITGVTLTDPNITIAWSGVDQTFVDIEVTGWETTGVLSPPGRGHWWKVIDRFTAGTSGPYSASQALEANMVAQYGARPGSGRVFARIRGLSPVSGRAGLWISVPFLAL